jgi:competence protein ComEA
VSRVPDAAGARFALVLALLFLAPVGSAVPEPPPALAPAWIDGECRLAAAGAAAPCACEAIPGTLRRALGWPIPLTTATAADLEALPGIGPARARAIADERARGDRPGGAGALERVPGLGPATIARLRPLVLASGQADPACAGTRSRAAR